MVCRIRYSLFIIPYILLIALFGKKLMLFLNLILAFPTWKTIVNWRSKYIQKYRISLDGKEDSIDSMIRTYISDNDDLRIVLAIDAASASSRVSVSNDGVVKGLLYTKTTNEAQKILSTSQEFAKFVEAHLHEIIRYYFIIYACPLSPLNRAFPIALIPKTSGNANKDIVCQFEKIVQKVSSKLKVIGVAFDGDSGWLPMAKKAAISTRDLIVSSIFRNEPLLSLDNYVIFQDEKHPDNKQYLIFEDLLHLLKCFRYRICSGCGVCPSLYSDENNFIKNLIRL